MVLGALVLAVICTTVNASLPLPSLSPSGVGPQELELEMTNKNSPLAATAMTELDELASEVSL